MFKLLALLLVAAPILGQDSACAWQQSAARSAFERGLALSKSLDDAGAARVAVLTRELAIDKLVQALEAFDIKGPKTNIPAVIAILRSEQFRSGDVHTGLLADFPYSPTTIEVLDGGTQTTVQDYPGRLGYWEVGVPPSGPCEIS